MKTCHIYVLLIIASSLFVSCKDEYIADSTFIPTLSPHYLRPTETSFSHYLGWAFEETFEVESNETSWEFTDVPDWVTLSPNSSDKTEKVLLSVNENPSAETSRTAIFYLSSTETDWQYSRAMSVSQYEASPNLSIENNILSFGGGTETQTIVVKANCTWSVSNNTSWISVDSDNENNILTVKVSPNPESSYRTGYFYINYRNKNLSVSVKQAPAGITTSQTSLHYENVASSYKLSLEAEADWSSSSSDSWIKVTPTSGKAGISDVTIEVTPNTTINNRKGFVTFYTNGNSKLQIEVIQKGLYIEADKELHFPDTGGDINLNIRSNTDWQVISAPNWLTISETKGSGNATISINATENQSSIARSGEIRLEQPGLNLFFSVSVTQGKKFLEPNVPVIDFTDKASTSSFKIFSNSRWTSSFADSWYSVTPLTGTGNCDIEVNVTENNSAIERTGTIQYLYADNFANVNIHQLAKYLTIDNKTFDFASIGGAHTIEICSNDKWTVEFEHQVSWLHLSSQSGEGDGELVITADDNPTINVRSTTIIIKSEYSQDIRILVSQQPKKLAISTSRILFFSEGGFSETIEINTEGKYKIDYDPSWFTVNQTNNNTFSVFAAENKDNEFRKGKITISLTDLVDCSLSIELSVVQAGIGGSFIINGFEEDKDWNAVNSGNLSVIITGYNSDTNWSDIFGGSLKVNITGYTTDEDWNLNDYLNGRATIIRYGSDKDWNNCNDGSGKLDKGEYYNDANWNEEYLINQ